MNETLYNSKTSTELVFKKKFTLYLMRELCKVISTIFHFGNLIIIIIKVYKTYEI